MKKILLKNAKVVDDKGIRKSDILIDDEKIAAEEKRGFFEEGEQKGEFKIIDLDGKYIFPGIIDAHTHYLLRSRGTVTADDFYQGSIAAAAGGVTTVIDHHASGIQIKGSLNTLKTALCDEIGSKKSIMVVTPPNKAEILPLSKSSTEVYFPRFSSK